MCFDVRHFSESLFGLSTGLILLTISMSSCGLGVRLVDVTGGDALVSFSSSKCDINVMLRFVPNASLFVSMHNGLDCVVKADSLFVAPPPPPPPLVKRNPLPFVD